MNWLQKLSSEIRTEDFPNILSQALQYEIGGNWESSPSVPWTEKLENITKNKSRSQEKGYSSGFWVNCKDGDGTFNQKWGVNINFTVTSGTSHTVFDSATGDWDFSIDASVQWASPKSWTPESPYALLIRSAGARNGMKTIQEVVNFVKWTDIT